MKILVGYTGFVGSNLYKQLVFDYVFNSSNISDAFGLSPDVCIYSGVKSQKFLANKNPNEDLEHILEAIENIKKINPKKLILISTIDVLCETQNTYEDYESNSKNLMPYGKHRKVLEDWVVTNIKDHHIIRLPGLFGENLKKNFLYDIMNPIPTMLSNELYLMLSDCSSIISNSYEKKTNDLYYLREDLSLHNQQELLKVIKDRNFSSLYFTDSRSEFQFYPLSRLAKDLLIVIEHNIPIIQLVTEPVIACEVYYYLRNDSFENEISQNYPIYNLKTRYSKYWGKSDGYLMNKVEVLDGIKLFYKLLR